jgi:hypothetical protein
MSDTDSNEVLSITYEGQTFYRADYPGELLEIQPVVVRIDDWLVDAASISAIRLRPGFVTCWAGGKAIDTQPFDSDAEAKRFHAWLVAQVWPNADIREWDGK